MKLKYKKIFSSVFLLISTCIFIGTLGFYINKSNKVLQNNYKTPMYSKYGSIEKLSLGDSDSGVVVKDGDGNEHLYMWGNDNYGQIGNGINGFDSDGQTHRENILSPLEITKAIDANGNETTLIPKGSSVTQFSIGYQNSMIVIEDSSNIDHIYSWGFGAIGNGSTDVYNMVTIPTEITKVINGEGNEKNIENLKITQLSVGFGESAMVAEDVETKVNHFYVWGNSIKTPTEIINAQSNLSVPQPLIPEGGKITQLSMGSGTFFGLVVEDSKNMSHLYTWSYSGHFQIPTEVIEAKNQKGEFIDLLPKDSLVKKLSLGGENYGVVIQNTADKTDHLYMWGNNESGQLGNGGVDSNESVSIPTEIANTNTLDKYGNPLSFLTPGSEIKYLSLGGGLFGQNHTAMVTKDKDETEHLFLWGNDESGQIGNGDNSLGKKVSTPTEINNKINYKGKESKLLPKGSKVKQISLGREHTGMVVEDIHGINHLYMWGDDYDGQLGDGNIGNNYNVDIPIENQFFTQPSLPDDPGSNLLLYIILGFTLTLLIIALISVIYFFISNRKISKRKN